MDELTKYFPELTMLQREQFALMGDLYADWNAKINVVSRKDIDNLYLHHVLHSLSIAKFVTPVEGSMIIDLGTGGGFPGIPLAVMWPKCSFHLIDRVGKKLTVASEVARGCMLENVTLQHGDALECKLKGDYIVSRAVMELGELWKISARLLGKKNKNSFPNGLICLKGGDLEPELASIKRPVIEVPLTDYFTEDYFKEKYLIYVQG